MSSITPSGRRRRRPCRRTVAVAHDRVVDACRPPRAGSVGQLLAGASASSGSLRPRGQGPQLAHRAWASARRRPMRASSVRSSRSAMVARRAVFHADQADCSWAILFRMVLRPRAAGLVARAPPRARRSTRPSSRGTTWEAEGCRSRGWPGRRPRWTGGRASEPERVPTRSRSGAASGSPRARRSSTTVARNTTVSDSNASTSASTSERLATSSSGSHPSVWSTRGDLRLALAEPARRPGRAVLDRVLADDPGQHDLAAAPVDEPGEQLAGVEGEAERRVDEDLEPLVDGASSAVAPGARTRGRARIDRRCWSRPWWAPRPGLLPRLAELGRWPGSRPRRPGRSCRRPGRTGPG